MVAASNEIHSDPRVRSIEWRDLVQVNRFEIAAELALPLCWLGASLLTAASGHWLVALGLSFMFYLTGLRIVHNAFHGALGLSRGATNAVLWVMSLLMLGSMHAVKFNHLRHHQLKIEDGDIEGLAAEMPAWKTLLLGPLFPLRLHWHALRIGNRKLRVIILAELFMNILWIGLVFGIWGCGVMRYHIGSMAVGQCFSAFFAVWTVHHHCDRTHFIARTLRNRLKNAITFDMFRHVEHHLFPLVPTCHLAELSKRIDVAAPELKTKIVF